jgi:hypothetical protein
MQNASQLMGKRINIFLIQKLRSIQGFGVEQEGLYNYIVTKFVTIW